MTTVEGNSEDAITSRLTSSSPAEYLVNGCHLKIVFIWFANPFNSFPLKL